MTANWLAAYNYLEAVLRTRLNSRSPISTLAEARTLGGDHGEFIRTHSLVLTASTDQKIRVARAMVAEKSIRRLKAAGLFFWIHR